MKNYRIYICFIVLATLMILLYPKEGKFQYEYQKGRPWVYETLISPIDFPILKTEEEMLREKEERASETIDYYTYDASVGAPKLELLGRMALEARIDDDLARELYSHLREAYSRGIVSSFGNVDLSEKVIFVKRDKRVVETPASEVYNLDQAKNILKSALVYGLGDRATDSIASRFDLDGLVVPNLFFDENTTELVHKEAVNYISPTKGMVYAGQLIVSEGETVTGDICQILDSYKAEYKMSYGYSGSPDALLVSHLMTVFVILAAFFFTLYFCGKEVFGSLRRLIFLMLLLFISFAGVVVMFRADQRLLYLFPFAVMALYMSAFFRDDISFPVYTVTLLPLLVIPENGVELFFINLIGGSVVLLAHGKWFNRGWLQFVNIIFIFIAMVLVSFSFKLGRGDVSYAFKSTDFLYLGINSVLVIVLYPFVFLFEIIFGLISYARLWELCDTNNRLLQQLQYKAPGTFQHSLQVANIAENAARQVGADAMLVRVGALYHDIGKIENPLCFTENQTAEQNYHQHLTPEQSARDIIRHVDDGLALARKNNLPEQVVDIIASHHGTTKTMYFYTKYCNAGGDPSNTEPFTYKGKLPVDKEAVILMFADSVEAASRSLRDYSPESISEMVNRIIDGKIAEGQVAKGDITMAEIDTVKQVFIENLQQMYHGRVAYPEPVKKD